MKNVENIKQSLLFLSKKKRTLFGRNYLLNCEEAFDKSRTQEVVYKIQIFFQRI